MKNYKIVLIALVIFYSTKGYAQEVDSVKQAKIKYISKDLGLNMSNSEKVVAVMDDYKKEAKTIINDPQIKESDKRSKLDILIDKKNESLKKLLNKQQLKKFIPTSENRTPGKKDTIAKG